MATKEVADPMVEVLADAGVRRMYGVSGDSLNGITDSIRATNSLQWVHTRHEETAAFAAGAEAPGPAGNDCPKAPGRSGFGKDWLGSARKKELASATNSATEKGATAASAFCVAGAAEGMRFVGSGLFVLMVTANFDVLENTQRILSEDGG